MPGIFLPQELSSTLTKSPKMAGKRKRVDTNGEIEDKTAIIDSSEKQDAAQLHEWLVDVLTLLRRFVCRVPSNYLSCINRVTVQT